MILCEFRVSGNPEPQGSMRAFIPKGWGRAVLTSSNKKLKSWRQDVSLIASESMAIYGIRGSKPWARPYPVSVDVIFCFQKPKSTPKRILWKTTKPDLDKLIRGLFDAMTGICFEDDSQVHRVSAVKVFGDTPHCWVQVNVEDATNGK